MQTFSKIAGEYLVEVEAGKADLISLLRRLSEKELPSIKLKLWKEYFWTKGFYVSSTGSTHIDVVKNYIINQGEKVC